LKLVGLEQALQSRASSFILSGLEYNNEDV